MKIALAVAALVLVAGCGSSASSSSAPTVTASPSTAPGDAWRAEAASIGISPPDWDHYVEVFESSFCAHEGSFETLAALSLDDADSTQTLKLNQMGFKYGCPDRLNEWNAAVASVLAGG